MRRALGRRRILLASGSPRRRQLLKAVGIRFSVVGHQIVEHEYKTGDPFRIAIKLAYAKAHSAAQGERSGLIVGVDTIVVLGNDVLGKPVDAREARRMLSALSGKTHCVISGVAVIDRRRNTAMCSRKSTRVCFQPLTPQWIERYIATGAPFDKAGAYGIQDDMVSQVARSGQPVDNVIGLPLGALAAAIERLN